MVETGDPLEVIGNGGDQLEVIGHGETRHINEDIEI
jgi:hypothetical protein